MKNHTVLAVVALLALSGEAYAERRQNSLATDVAVRRRRLLVKHRLEFTPLFESTINADFRHIVGGGAKLEFHLSDMLSIGAIGVAAAPALIQREPSREDMPRVKRADGKAFLLGVAVETVRAGDIVQIQTHGEAMVNVR